jgi:hypothetical protein
MVRIIGKPTVLARDNTKPWVTSWRAAQLNWVDMSIVAVAAAVIRPSLITHAAIATAQNARA